MIPPFGSLRALAQTGAADEVPQTDRRHTPVGPPDLGSALGRRRGDRLGQAVQDADALPQTEVIAAEYVRPLQMEDAEHSRRPDPDAREADQVLGDLDLGSTVEAV